MTVDTPHGRNCNCHTCAPIPWRRATDHPGAAVVAPYARELVAATFNQENER